MHGKLYCCKKRKQAYKHGVVPLLVERPDNSFFTEQQSQTTKRAICAPNIVTGFVICHAFFILQN